MKKKEEDGIIEIFEKCLEKGNSEWSDIHKDARADKKFIQFGLQLINDDGTDQKLKGRPRFIINKLIGFVMSESNKLRTRSISGKVYPIDNGADIEKAKARQGVARGIERTSNAERAYRYAGTEAITGGMGAYRLDIVPVSDKSFDHTMEINRILDATTVMAGPGVKEDYSDSKWFIVKQKAEPFSEHTKDYDRINNDDVNSDYWGNDGSPYEYEFWYLKEVKDTLYRFKDGTNVFKSQVKPDASDEAFQMGPDGERVQRKTTRKKWTQYKLKAKSVKDKKAWPGRWAPIFIVNGREVLNDNKRKLLSLCRYSKDSQRLYNYARQEMGRNIGFTPKAIWMAAIEAIPKKVKNMWDTAHENTYSTMYYNDKDSAGRTIAPPTLIQNHSLDPQLSQEVSVTDVELKDTSGVQAENLAMTSNATSKVAIDAKRMEGDENNYDFQDNVAIAVQHSTKCIVDLIPKVIDTPRQVRMIGEDDAETIIKANSEYRDKKTGEIKFDYYFTDEEDYDVGVSVGPSHESKRTENQEVLMELMRTSEAAAQVLPYLFVGNMDFSAAPEAKKLLKKLLPPGIAEPSDEDEEEGEAALPPEVIQQLEEADQMKAVIEEVSKELEELKSSKEVEVAKIEQDREADNKKLIIEAEKVDIDRYEAETNRLEAIQKSKDSAQKIKDDAQSRQDLEDRGDKDFDLEVSKKEIQAEFDEKLSAVEEKGRAKIDELMSKLLDKGSDKVEQPAINIINNIPKAGGKKTISGPGGEYTVESTDD